MDEADLMKCIVLHHQAMIKITLDNQLVMVNIWGEMVRSEGVPFRMYAP